MNIRSLIRVLAVSVLIAPYSTTLSAWTISLPSEPEQVLGTTIIDNESVDNNDISVGLSLDHRQDDFSFSIGFANPGEGRPDTLSELNWSNQDLLGLTLHIRGTQPGWTGVFTGGHAWGYDGEVRDSDWAQPGRQQEFSRSVAETEGSTAGDAILGVGYRFVPVSSLKLVPLLGYEYHRLHWRIGHGWQALSELVDGEQIAPNVGVGYDAKSHYRANYKGLWLGMGLELELPNGFSLECHLKRSRYDYNGSGNWAQRKDFAHPESFRHEADGQGNQTELALNYAYNATQFRVSYADREWESASGSSTTFFVGGQQSTIRLNQADWRSKQVSLAIEKKW